MSLVPSRSSGLRQANFWFLCTCFFGRYHCISFGFVISCVLLGFSVQLSPFGCIVPCTCVGSMRQRNDREGESKDSRLKAFVFKMKCDKSASLSRSGFKLWSCFKNFNKGHPPKDLTWTNEFTHEAVLLYLNSKNVSCKIQTHWLIALGAAIVFAGSSVTESFRRLATRIKAQFLQTRWQVAGRVLSRMGMWRKGTLVCWSGLQCSEQKWTRCVSVFLVVPQLPTGSVWIWSAQPGTCDQYPDLVASQEVVFPNRNISLFAQFTNQIYPTQIHVYSGAQTTFQKHPGKNITYFSDLTSVNYRPVGHKVNLLGSKLNLVWDTVVGFNPSTRVFALLLLQTPEEHFGESHCDFIALVWFEDLLNESFHQHGRKVQVVIVETNCHWFSEWTCKRSNTGSWAFGRFLLIPLGTVPQRRAIREEMIPFEQFSITFNIYFFPKTLDDKL